MSTTKIYYQINFQMDGWMEMGKPSKFHYSNYTSKRQVCERGDNTEIIQYIFNLYIKSTCQRQGIIQ